MAAKERRERKEGKGRKRLEGLGIDRSDAEFVPEGHRRKLAGGKTAPAGAAPG